MTQKQLLEVIANWLDKAGINYMITGAWSVIFYGRVRTSHDLDFIVEMKNEDIPKMKQIFDDAGKDFMFQDFAIREAINDKSMFNVIYLPTLDKIDFWILKDSEFDKERFSRRVKVKAWDQTVYITSPEDTVVQKLYWFDQSQIDKHLVDAAFVYQLQDKLDHEYITKWSKKLSVEKYLPELQKVNLEDYY